MFGSSRSIVGLDIGSSCIKAIELKRAKGEIQVKGFHQPVKVYEVAA